MNLIKITDPNLLKFITIINSSVKKFRTLINDISVIARIESDMLTMELVDVEEIIANIEWSLQGKIKKPGTVITKSVAIKQILFSKKNLRSILYNLVANGIKFANGTSPLIHITVIKNTDHILLSVNDNGIGIDQNQMDIIFSMYGRLNKEMEGQGIGLYLAKKIIGAANGNMTVESEIGKGSTFNIFLPLPVVIAD